MCVYDGILFCFEAFWGQRIGRVERACEFGAFSSWVFVAVSNSESEPCICHYIYSARYLRWQDFQKSLEFHFEADMSRSPSIGFVSNLFVSSWKVLGVILMS